MTYPTCGEISCDECNDRYEKALARIAELEQMVRELVEVTGAEYHVVAGDQYHMLCPGSAIKLNTNAAWIVALYGDRSAHKTKERVANIKAARSKAIALLQPEAGKEVGK